MISFDASTVLDLAPTAEVLAAVHRAADHLDIQFMVVGAAARDLLISHVVGTSLARATRDIDVAVAVSSWDEVGKLTSEMSRADRSAHKFLIGSTEVDIIPFGDIENDKRVIRWPDDHEMNVLGFKEAYDAAVHVKLPGGLVVAVAALPAQSLLKLFAWRDRRHVDTRDAVDLRSIIQAYSEGRYGDELYEESLYSLLERFGFDPMSAGAYRMGIEASGLLSAENQLAVTNILDAEELLDALVGDMRGIPSVNYSLLSAYRDGFRPDRQR